MIYDQHTAGFDTSNERRDRLLGTRRVLHNAETHHVVKRGRCNWQVLYVGLADKIVGSPTVISVVRYDSVRQITCEYLGAGGKQQFGEIPCTTARFKNTPASQSCQRTTQRPSQS